MNTRFSFIFQLFTAGLCVCLLSACGGGSDGDSTTGNTTPNVEKINGIEVPPAPDTAKNNATLAGVDSNNNGVRDDVERGVAKISISKLQYNTYISIAKEYQKTLTADNMSHTDMERSQKIITCLIINSNEEIESDDAIKKIVINSTERKNAIRKKLAGFGGVMIEEGDCSK